MRNHLSVYRRVIKRITRFAIYCIAFEIDFILFRAPIDEGNERTVVIDKDLTTSDGLAVDWIYNHIYWTDTEKNTIELANFEGNMRKTLITDRVQVPRAIALNPLEGWMFWTDWGEKARIEKAGMDGSHRSVSFFFIFIFVIFFLK